MALDLHTLRQPVSLVKSSDLLAAVEARSMINNGDLWLPDREEGVRKYKFTRPSDSRISAQNVVGAFRAMVAEIVAPEFGQILPDAALRIVEENGTTTFFVKEATLKRLQETQGNHHDVSLGRQTQL